MILVDTNVWGRIAQKSDPQHKLATDALGWAIRHNTPAIAAQSLYELWVVATRPLDKNGLGWPPPRAAAWMHACRRTCRFLPDDPRIFDIWSDLVTAHATQGKSAHDARLVASMRLNGIGAILTFNTGDFKRYGIHVIDPAALP